MAGPAASRGEALLLLGQAAADLEAGYRRMLADCLKHGPPLVVCTVYRGHFPEPSYRACVAVAPCAFNDRPAPQADSAAGSIGLIFESP